jgi:hydrogenase maturation protease
VRLLVAGIGNVFLGDDGFGVEVVRRLSGEPLAERNGLVDIADFGIRGVHLAYELAGGTYDAAILVDAAPNGGVPGTLYRIEPDMQSAAFGPANADAHGLTPAAVLAWVRQVGTPPSRLVIVGCEPGSLDESMALSPPVAAAIDGALQMIRELVAEMTAPIGEMPCA